MISSNVNERKRGIFVGDLASIAIIHRYKHIIVISNNKRFHFLN